MDALKTAISACGGPTALARAIGVSLNAPSMWMHRRSVPVEHCAAIEKATGGRVTRRHLRPDDWARVWPELVSDAAAETEVREAA